MRAQLNIIVLIKHFDFPLSVPVGGAFPLSFATDDSLAKALCWRQSSGTCSTSVPFVDHGRVPSWYEIRQLRKLEFHKTNIGILFS